MRKASEEAAEAAASDVDDEDDVRFPFSDFFFAIRMPA
jgi:hypothetical protein